MVKKLITFKAGWNGKAYPEGKEFTVANTMIPEKPLTKKQREHVAKVIADFGKKSGKKVTMKKSGGITTISFR